MNRMLSAKNSVPAEAKLAEAFSRLATHGLIGEDAGRFALSADAQKIVTGLPKKAEMAERVFEIRQRLAAHEAKGEHAAIMLTVEQLSAAIVAHRASGQGAGKNLLMPKPKTVEPERKRAGHWRKPASAARRRKA